MDWTLFWSGFPSQFTVFLIQFLPSDFLPQSKVAEDISETVSPDYASSLNVVYFPQLGYLICIPLLEEWKSGDGIVVLEGWTFQVRLISRDSTSVSHSKVIIV